MSATRERVTDHPLRSRSSSPLVPVPGQILTNFKVGETETQSLGSHSSSTTTFNTASLIQSAARSVFTPTSTNVSDDDNEDENDDCWSRERRQSKQQHHMNHPTLDSLQREAIPAMPDEHDRKRFVGCLAAVLSSAYDYDTADDYDEVHAAESYAHLTRTEQGHDSDDEDAMRDNYYSSKSKAKGETSDSSFYENEESYLSHSCSASFEYSDVLQLTGIPEIDGQSGRQKNRDGPSNAKKQKKSSIALNRHRRRRYDLLSNLLLSSAELLLLDKSQSRAFLPMLARLLMPPSTAQKINEFRTRQQKQQQQQQEYQNNAASSGNAKPTNFSVHSSTYNSPERNSTTSEKGINHYHFSPKTGIPISRQIPLQDDIFQPTGEECKSFLPSGVDEENHLLPFLESLSPGAGYRCLSLLLLQHLLHCSDGYDSRIRHVIKKLGVIVLLHDMKLERDLELVGDAAGDDTSQKMHCPRPKPYQDDDLVGAATRKFEALEHSLAVKLIRLSKVQQRLQEAQKTDKQIGRRKRSSRYTEVSSLAITREQFLRGLKIGSAGLVAGTIFAVTGGLAAPGIAAGVAAFAGSTAATAAVAALVSSTPAVTAIFGVGGGSLAAYKMNRRTQGLTEFEFRRQDKKSADRKYEDDEAEEAQAELFSTVCISGWLRDHHDFQRPWGILPTNPRIRDRLELLERFYAVYRPDHVNKCKSLLQRWKGEEKQLWELLRQKYGRDPDHLYPILPTNDCDAFLFGLTLEQEEVLTDLFVELGYVSDLEDMGKKHTTSWATSSALEEGRERLKNPFSVRLAENARLPEGGHTGRYQLSSKLKSHNHHVSPLFDESFYSHVGADGSSIASSGFDSVPSSDAASGAGTSNGDEEENERPKHISTVWDYHSKYGGEVYTVKWESEMLMEVCDSVADFAFDLINGATAQLLKQTALSTLISAVAVPFALVNAANMIDGTWTLAVERADEAGKELARSLLFSRAGHRPVTLVGFSFGARTIYSCLKELAKFQERWETNRETSENNSSGYCYEGGLGQGKNQNAWTLREPASIVEDVVVMGLPNHLSLGSWKACRQVVGGRLVNCYSRKDLILSLMFQIKRLAGGLRPVCGTCPVEVPGVENMDVSDIVSSHQDYCLVTGEILKRVRHGQPFRASTRFLGDTNGAMVTVYS